MGTYPEDGAGLGELPARGRALDHRKKTKEKEGRELDITSYEGGHERGGVQGYPKAITRGQNTVAQYIATRPIYLYAP